ncbi:FAD-dependent oxidoreductase [Patescibacteria group bacterium]|nr:FAD-dependent oxidoreductase [Patescibacteria group bacterium]
MTKTRVAIIGSGPTGYTAGIYAGRASLEPILFAGQKSGGQLMLTTEIENFPGFAQGKNGPELMIEMRQQAERFGAKIVDQYVYAVDFSVRPFKLWTHLPADANPEVLEKGKDEDFAQLSAKLKAEPHDYEADAVILAVGARSRMLGAPGEMEFLGRGVSTCAVCDAAFYKGKQTLVVGGGDAAMEDTLALTKFADSVKVLVRSDKMRASKIMQERVIAHPKVKVLYNTSIKEIKGEGAVKEAVLLNTATQAEEATPIDGVFIAIGHIPATGIFKGQLKLDSHGFILTRQSITAEGVEMAKAALDETGKVAFPTMTSVEGVFAGGDAVDVRYWQAVTAAGQGCAAAIDAERWLEGR